MNTIQGLWESYEKRAVPPGATETQRRETKRAFYAGCAGLFSIVDGPVGDQKNEETALRMLDGLHDEVKSFAARLKLGHE